LNPAFLLTSDQVEQAIKDGREAAKKGSTARDFVSHNAKHPYGVRGEMGIAHESGVICYSLDGFGISLLAFNAEAQYKPLNLPPGVDEQHNAFAKTLEFGVVLESFPNVQRNGKMRREAHEQDVIATRFVLTDDQGHVFEATHSEPMTEVQSGIQSNQGVAAVPRFGSSSTSTSMSANASGSSGSAFGYGSETSISSYYSTDYIPWSQSHPYYMASYRVSFPVFGADGQPLFTRTTKRITLHILTESGERAVDYDLKPPKL
jgi:hypothetical protein